MGCQRAHWLDRGSNPAVGSGTVNPILDPQGEIIMHEISRDPAGDEI
jgi:hypothetical protein